MARQSAGVLAYRCVGPEIDRAAWFDLETAATKINTAQAAFLERLAKVVEPAGPGEPA